VIAMLGWSVAATATLGSMRGYDWYGSAVNVAARLAAQAEPNEALVSAA
jgi:class 3 adenylate cyclase